MLLTMAVLSACSSGCLVLSLQPVYQDDSIAWDDRLLGTWRDREDNVEVVIERAEWRSYRIRYTHPIESSEFTAYLTAIGNEYFMDLMPARGHDYGAVLVPAHLVVRLRRDGDRLLVAPLDFDRFAEDLKAGRPAAGAAAAFDQKQNVILTGSTKELREWLRSTGGKTLSAEAVFERALR
jgi:hypothetical protein